MTTQREPGDPPICPYCGEVMRGRFRCPCREVSGVRAIVESAGFAVYEPTDAELSLPAHALRERVLRDRNNRAGVHYWPRATHLLRRGEFEKCR